MWIILGIIGSIIMVVIEWMAVTDIGYWWSVVPTVVGIIFQLGIAEVIFGIFD